jgi:hypothetical protein
MIAVELPRKFTISGTLTIYLFWNINHLPIDIISYIMSQIPRVVDRGNEEAGGKFR